jgi:hypothetical protein
MNIEISKSVNAQEDTIKFIHTKQLGSKPDVKTDRNEEKYTNLQL